MIELKIQISEDCELCKKGILYFKKLQKRNKKAYAGYILHPASRFVKEKRDLGEPDRIKGLTITPDYNGQGYLTHFHIKIEGE